MTRHRKIFRAALVTICAFYLCAPGEARALGCPNKELSPHAVVEVAEGIYVREGTHDLMNGNNAGGIANIGFIVGEKVVAVIDTGGSMCDGARLLAAIRKLTPLPIRYVINTHVHPDHVFGNSAFVKENSEFIGHYRLKRALLQRGPHYLKRFTELMGPEVLKGTEIVVPNHGITESETFDLGGRILRVSAHKTAHTDNDLTVLDLKTKTLWTGDLVFQGHIPVVDGRLTGWLDVIEDLTRLDVARAVPGHGPASISWPDGVQPQQEYLLKLAEDLRKIIARGGTMREAQKTAAHSEKGQWKLFDEFNARNASTGFAELEWE